ncbi:TetR/AcrR family transcriptional regulator [Nonomuraea sp. SYSU D8015]|uniref:TetR/AcrR family transcriptional regulator n=1 Tax=Nonomuraea sp. SYSU D8015 TaxID=2593644 RepID=UPI001660F0F2|nr:TetR/AcrR family transcriptional regulator [Nonomuraea sp. SYSU D8015]
MARRTQAQRTDATTGRLVCAARELFGGKGYADTSIDAIAAAAGVTKGAAYHHFGGKVALFRAAFIREQQEVAAKLERAAVEEGGGWVSLRRGCHAFLECCKDRRFRQIVLLDAQSVLGWEAVREMEYAHVLRVLLEGLRAAVEAGDVVDGNLAQRAQLLFGALCEGGMLLARSADPAADLSRLADETDRLLRAFKV